MSRDQKPNGNNQNMGDDTDDQFIIRPNMMLQLSKNIIDTDDVTNSSCF